MKPCDCTNGWYEWETEDETGRIYSEWRECNRCTETEEADEEDGNHTPLTRERLTMNKTATLVRDNLPRFHGHAALFRLDPPLEGAEYVIVSAANVAFSGPETYIFPGGENGMPTSWGELDGSRRGSFTHDEVLEDLGYTVVR